MRNRPPRSRQRNLLVKMTRYFIPEALRNGPRPFQISSVLREEDIVQLKLVEKFEQYCEEDGALNAHSGPESWEAFVNQTEHEQMEFVVRTLAETFRLGEFIARREINGVHKLHRLLDALLYLVARGNLVYDVQSDDWVFAKPVTAPPPQEMRRRIMNRILVSRDLQIATLRAMTHDELPRNQRRPAVQ